MKTIIISALLALNSITAEASFNRLWVGMKKKDVTAAQFLNGLNQTFFRDTIVVGKGRGLLSYQPYITRMEAHVPDELALVVYESEEKYRTIRSTPEGERYSAAHWNFFEKDVSKSTVSVQFAGVLTIGAAYELKPDYNWEEGNTLVTIYETGNNPDLKKLASLFGNRINEPGIKNSILLVTEKWLIEYASFGKESVAFKDLGKKLERAFLPQKKLQDLKGPVGSGEGVNFQI